MFEMVSMVRNNTLCGRHNTRLNVYVGSSLYIWLSLLFSSFLYNAKDKAGAFMDLEVASPPNSMDTEAEEEQSTSTENNKHISQ